MVEYYKAAKLEKSTDLKNYLLDKNYVILTTEVPVGDIVEYGLDWVVDILSVFHEGVAEGFSHHEKLLNALNEHVTILTRDFIKLKTDFLNLHAVNFSQLQIILDTYDDKLFDRIYAITDPIAIRASENWTEIDMLKQKVDYIFGEDVGTTTIIKFSLIDLGDIVEGLEGEFTENGLRRWSLFQWTWVFFSDPARFIYELADELIIRFF